MTQAYDFRVYETPRARDVFRPELVHSASLRDELYQRLRVAAGKLGLMNKPDDFAEAISELKSGGLLAVEAILDEAVACPREEVAHEAAELLAQFSANPGLIDEFDSTLRSTSSSVRRAVIVRALGYLNSFRDARLALLTRSLSDPDPEVRDRSVTALSQLGDARAVPALEGALHGESVAAIRDTICDTLAELRQ